MPDGAWTTIGRLSDILGLVSFLISIVTVVYVNGLRKNLKEVQERFAEEQELLLIKLKALRQNIWDDNLTDIKTESKLREELHLYLQRYRSILFPVGWYKIKKSLSYLDKGIDSSNKRSLCSNIDYLVARFRKNEVSGSGH